MSTGTFRNMSIAIDSLEAYRDLLTQSNSDGISRQTASILNVGLNSAYRNLGLHNRSTGLESYTTCTSRDGLLKATVSIESLTQSIKDGLTKLWEWLVKKVKAIKEWFSGNKKKLEEAKDKNEESLKAADEVDEEELTLKYKIPASVANSIRGYISKDNKLVTGKEFAEGLNLINKYMETISQLIKTSTDFMVHQDIEKYKKITEDLKTRMGSKLFPLGKLMLPVGDYLEVSESDESNGFGNLVFNYVPSESDRFDEEVVIEVESLTFLKNAVKAVNKLQDDCLKLTVRAMKLTLLIDDVKFNPSSKLYGSEADFKKAIVDLNKLVQNTVGNRDLTQAIRSISQCSAILSVTYNKIIISDR